MVIFALVTAMVPHSNVKAIDNDETKTYIIVTDDQKSHKKATQQIGDDVISENEILEENNVIVAEISESEAEVLDKEKGVLCVEEDFYMEANSLDEPDWEEDPPLSREEVTDIKRAYREEMDAIMNREYVEPEDYEWNMKVVDANDIDADESTRIRVAVLDSGVDIVRGIEIEASVNLVPEEQNITPMFLDMSGHGTGVASIIAGTSQNEVQGVNPNAALYSVKVLDAANKAPVSRIIEGIYWCIENDMQIINMSFGTPIYSKALQNAIEEAYEAGILIIGAAGNNADDVEYPAAFPEVMAVAATGTDSQMTDFSNIGDELEIAAPGEKIKVISFFGGSTIAQGTSISAPHITGAASLLWEKDPSKSNEFIRQLLSYSAKNIENSNDCGLLDVEYALEIYDEFAENFDGTMAKEEFLPENTEVPETFEYISDDDNYVEGRWTQGSHISLVENGYIENDASITAERAKILKVGAVYPDGEAKISGIAFDNKHMVGFHGLDGNNYIARYELLSRIALKYGNAAGINWSSIPGLTQKSYNGIAGAFKEPNKVGTKTWKQIFTYVDKVYGTTVGAKYGSNESNDKVSRRRFIWGMTIHYLSDIFAHNTYQKSSGKPIVHKGDYINANTQVNGADTVTTVKRRYDVAKAAVESAIWCNLNIVYGNYCELDDGLYFAPEYTGINVGENFRKSKLLTYAKSNSGNSLSSAERNRFTAASIND